MMHMDKILAEKDELLHKIKIEKYDLQTRLSSIAGDKLTKGNPAITDIGDPNRPLKIGEKYGELYDNEWTDAMECNDEVKNYFPHKRPHDIEEIVIHHLHRILVTCYQECLKLSSDQFTTLRQTVDKIVCSGTETEKLFSLPGFKDIALIRRQNADIFVRSLLQRKDVDASKIMNNWEYEHKNDKLVDVLLKTDFFEKCIYLCWSMVVQDPIMHLDEELQAGEKLDKNVYKEFIQSGDTVRYVVWPALFLHKDGPLLYKGVVQAGWSSGHSGSEV